MDPSFFLEFLRIYAIMKLEGYDIVELRELPNNDLFAQYFYASQTRSKKEEEKRIREMKNCFE